MNTPASPPWTNTTKLVVGLSLVAIIAGLLIRFQSLIAPLILAFVLTYLFYPLASWLSARLRIRWGAAVGMIYLVLLLVLLGLLTLGGVGLVGQVQSLIAIVQVGLQGLPAWVDRLTAQVIQIGPFALDLSVVNLDEVSRELLGLAQSLLGQTGSLIGTLAGGALEAFGLTLFVLLVSYFMLAESRGLPGRMLPLDIPGYEEDLRRLGRELGRIWNAFLRGQILIILLTIVIYTLLLGLLGVRYAFGLALLAGLARFLPYIGPAINWVVLGLVVFFQSTTLFGMPSWLYLVVVVGLAWLVDLILDNLVVPRLMADALRVHPAAVLVAALIAASLLGLLGVVLAAPMLATLKLVWQYVTRKMFDQDPWPEPEPVRSVPPTPRLLRRLRIWWKALQRK